MLIKNLKKLMPGPQSSELGADIADLFLTSATKFAKMRELLVIYVALASLLYLIFFFRFLTIFFSFLEQVAQIYRDRSIGCAINIVVVKIAYLDTKNVWILNQTKLLTLYPVTSVCIFSTLFSIHFLRC